MIGRLVLAYLVSVFGEESFDPEKAARIVSDLAKEFGKRNATSKGG